VVRFLPEALAEYLHEVACYSSVGPGYGVRFKDAVKSAAARLLTEPAIGTPATQGTRKVRIKGFPFSIVYRRTGAELLSVAIAADRRRPNCWLGRRRERHA
jgi:plasmid stabilization system protein ParE